MKFLRSHYRNGLCMHHIGAKLVKNIVHELNVSAECCIVTPLRMLTAVTVGR